MFGAFPKGSGVAAFVSEETDLKQRYKVAMCDTQSSFRIPATDSAKVVNDLEYVVRIFQFQANQPRVFNSLWWEELGKVFDLVGNLRAAEEGPSTSLSVIYINVILGSSLAVICV